ncbi:MAG: PAS domain-containing protein, partial [Candidatus Latescibacteria bacterium]|nr:PAS domain-containing protein [Candidatus Latescibacterota bacterium]
MARSSHDAHRPVGESETEAFSESYAMFAETLERLEGSYRNLESRFDSLNRELESTNLRLQESLREKEQLSGDLNEILESLGSGVLAVDCDGVIRLFNRAASEIIGWSAQEALSLRCEDVLADGAADLRQVLANGERVYGREKTLCRRDGGSVSIRYSTSRLLGPDGQVAGAVETFEDISQLQQLSKQASRVGTLTALGEMAGTVAHEIRNPLGGIGGFAGLLERDLDVEDSRRRLVKKIIEGVDSLNRMVTNLLNYTRPVQLNIRPADLVQVVEDSLGFFEIDAGNRLEQIELQR